MSAIPDPPEAGTYRNVVGYFAEIIATDPTRRYDAVELLKGSLTTRPEEWSKGGVQYGVWAGIEDIRDAYGDPSAFDGAAKAAATEWLDVRDDTDEDAWVARWNTWIQEYAATHSTRF